MLSLYTKNRLMLFVLLINVGLSMGCCYADTSANAAGKTKINPKDGAEMIWIPAGEFLLGSTKEQIAALIKASSIREDLQWRYQLETPQRKIHLDGYWIYKCPVSVSQYKKFCEETGRDMPGLTPSWGWVDEHPVVNMTWLEAADYAKWAGAALPSEAQWEKAARGTDGRAYPWGNEWDSSLCINSVEGDTTNRPRPVGTHPVEGASPYGVMDMAGNVWEYCDGWFDPDYYKKAADRNPKSPAEPVMIKRFGPEFKGARIVRGGSWLSSDPSHFRTTYRLNLPPDNFGSRMGFRCVVNP